jgi:hypothetical protein
MTEIIPKSEKIPADAIHAGIQSSQTNGSRRHLSFLSIRSPSTSCFPGPSNSTLVAMIQSARGFSHLAFPSSYPIDVCRVGILPSSSDRSQISFLACCKFACMHHKNTWLRDILHCRYHQDRSETSSSLFILPLVK